MKIRLVAIGKTDNKFLERLISKYVDRLHHYVRFEMECIPDIKNVKHLSKVQQKEKEGEALLKRLGPQDVLVLFDEHGKQLSSLEFSQYLQHRMNAGIKCLVFAVGGPYGFSDAVYEKAQGKIGVSKMTFSHQMVRLLIVEQIYRGFTILRNEPYHHE